MCITFVIIRKTLENGIIQNDKCGAGVWEELLCVFAAQVPAIVALHFGTTNIFIRFFVEKFDALFLRARTHTSGVQSHSKQCGLQI